MKKEDLHFYLICPKCFRQDHLTWEGYKKYVMADRFCVGKVRGETMEGQYLCPYGCRAVMGVFSIGTEEEVCADSDAMFDKYFKRIPADSFCFKSNGLSVADAKKMQRKHRTGDISGGAL